MSKNQGIKGDALQGFVAPAGGVTSGTPTIVEAMFCVPETSALVGATFVGRVAGVSTSLVKAAGFTTAIGQAAYYDFAALEFQGTDSATNRKVGCFTSVLAAGILLCDVRLDGVAFGAGNEDIESKADKIVPATPSSLAGLNAAGNLEDTTIETADVPTMAAAGGEGAFVMTAAADRLQSNSTVIAARVVQMKAVDVTVLAEASTGVSAADAEIASADVAGYAVISGNDQAVESLAVAADGVVTVTLAGNSTGDSIHRVMVRYA